MGAVTCLIVSWFYIFLLKAKVRDCMTYIQYRIDKVNPNPGKLNRGPEAGDGSKGTGDPSRPRYEGAATPALGGLVMEGRPKLIVGGSGSSQPLQYVCSHCLRPFHFPGNQPPKEAVAELLQSFGEHVEREHADAASFPNTPPVEGEIPDSH